MTLFPSGVTPETEQLAALRGFTFRRTVTFYEDAAKTKPLNLTGLTVKIVIGGFLTLTNGAGLTVTAAKGEVAIRLTPEQTAKAPADQLHYVVSFEESAEEIVPPLVGTLTFNAA